MILLTNVPEAQLVDELDATVFIIDLENHHESAVITLR